MKLPGPDLPEWAICAEVGSYPGDPVSEGTAPEALSVTTDMPIARAVPSSGPGMILRDGRVMHYFRAGQIPSSPPPDTATLLDKVRRKGVVLVADGIELHVVERWRGQLHAHTLRALTDAAGGVIATLRGEHRERVSRQPECVAEYDPKGRRRDSGRPQRR